MERLREDILWDNEVSTPSSKLISTPSISSSTARFSDSYIYGAGIVAVLAITVCAFFPYNNKFSQAANVMAKTPYK